MRLTRREIATVLAALRWWQDRHVAIPWGLADHFADHPPLTDDEAARLCERLNIRPVRRRRIRVANGGSNRRNV